MNSSLSDRDAPSDEQRAAQREFALNRSLRHLQAAAQSDVEELQRNLFEAAQRFMDLADMLEKRPSADHCAFMRASARRYVAASGLSRTLWQDRKDTSGDTRGEAHT